MKNKNRRTLTHSQTNHLLLIAITPFIIQLLLILCWFEISYWPTKFPFFFYLSTQTAVIQESISLAVSACLYSQTNNNKTLFVTPHPTQHGSRQFSFSCIDFHPTNPLTVNHKPAAASKYKPPALSIITDYF